MLRSENNIETARMQEDSCRLIDFEAFLRSESGLFTSSSASYSEDTNASSQVEYCSCIVTNHLKLCKSTTLIKMGCAYNYKRVRVNCIRW
jgi:hypothetical protein